MSDSSALKPARALRRIAFAGLAAALLGGCSSEVARFDSFSNPFASNPTDQTPVASLAKTKTVQKFATAATPSPKTVAAAQLAPASVGSIKGVTGSAAGWGAVGGTPIVVAQGESVDMLSNRYGVPVDALLKVNGFSSASQVQPGSRLVIPVYNAASTGRPAAAAPKVAELKPARAADDKPVKAKAARAEDKHAEKTPAKTAKAEPVKKTEPAKKAAKAEPAKKVASAEPRKHEAAKTTGARQAKKPEPAKKATVAEATKPARPEPVKPAKTAAVIAPAAAAAPKKAVVPDPTPTASIPPVAARADTEASGAPEFRWPARGRIIQGFKAGGNDGINIAVPEGTSVKAAEGGVVAYAGNELKGYGNLVLIRHPNGYVSAYANNGELNVKRGEQVKRGQTIAKSGQTGNVSSPQLHFELRKGSTPVDPTSLLAGL